MSPSYSIAVVGAGVAGLAAASFLKENGHKPLVFERFAAPKPIGAGLLIQPTGLAVLDRLGCGDAARELGSRIDQVEGRLAGRDHALFDMRYEHLVPGLHGLAMHRASLFHVLHQALVARAITVEASAELIALEDAPGGVRLVGADGRRHGPFDLVVDASGARSRLREGLATATSIKPFRYGAVWGVGRDTGFARNALQQRYHGARVMIGVLPVGRLPDDTTPLNAFFWSMPAAALDQWESRPLEAWRAEVAGHWPETAGLTAQFLRHDDMTRARYAQLTVRRPFGERLVLIGDAAHQTSPQLGQGANMALLDAAALADCLRAYPDLASALPAYARQRRAHVRFYQAASWALTPLFQSDSRLAGLLRDALFARVSRLPWISSEMVRLLAGVKTGPFTAAQAERLAGWR